MHLAKDVVNALRKLLLAAALVLLLPTAYAGAADNSSSDSVPPGTVVNFSNWQKYQQYMTEGMISLFKGDHFWSFPKNAEFVIGPTIPIGRPKLYIENTEKYGNQAR